MLTTSLAVLLVLLLALFIILSLDERKTTCARWPLALENGNVVSVKFIYSSLLARILRSLFNVYALTIWHRVYVAKGYLVSAGMQHELEHVRQWHRYGPIGFPVRYLWYLLRVGFDRHPLEHDALWVGNQLPRPKTR